MFFSAVQQLFLNDLPFLVPVVLSVPPAAVLLLVTAVLQ